MNLLWRSAYIDWKRKEYDKTKKKSKKNSVIENKIKSLNIKLPELAPEPTLLQRLLENYYISLVKSLLMKMQNL